MKQFDRGIWGVAGLILPFLLLTSFLTGCGTQPTAATYTDSEKSTHQQTSSANITSSDKENAVKQDQTSQPMAPVPEKAEPEKPVPTNDETESLGEILRERGISGNTDFSVVVEKRSHILSIYHSNQKLRSYHVEIGDNGLGDKEISGDHKTPEGIFYITEKSLLDPPDRFLGTRWMRLSYPNIEDAERGFHEGIINRETYETILWAIHHGEIPPQDTALGGGVGIHGGTSPELGSNWTWGCIGLSNCDVNDFYDYIQVGTPVIIRK